MLLGEIKDSVEDLQARIVREDREHANAMQQLGLQMQLLRAQKEMLGGQLTKATSTSTRVQAQLALVRREARRLRGEVNKRHGRCTRGIDEVQLSELPQIIALRSAMASKSGTIHPGDLLDCHVSDWNMGECSVPCDNSCPENATSTGSCGGMVMFERDVVQPANSFGTPCPALSWTVRCNQVRCPVDCEISQWSSWSACTRRCNGGVRQRTRSVVRRPQHGGLACASTMETHQCGMGACSRDCTLKSWSGWSACTAVCGGGYQERRRPVHTEASGDYSMCPSELSSARYETRRCNPVPCLGDERCLARQDILLALDSSASWGSSGFGAVRKFADSLIMRYNSSAYGQPAARVGVIQFGNGEVRESGVVPDAAKLTDLQADMASVRNAVAGTRLLSGFSNLAQAFTLAGRMFRDQGRRSASRMLLLVTDGRPPFRIHAMQQARELRAAGVRIFVVGVVGKACGKDATVLEALASVPAAANYVHVPGKEALGAEPDVWARKVLAASCPRARSPRRAGRREQEQGFRLIREGQGCGQAGRALLGEWVDTAAACSELAKEAGRTYFAYGTGPHRGRCYSEAFSNGHCVNGSFQPDALDLYECLAPRQGVGPRMLRSP